MPYLNIDLLEYIIQFNIIYKENYGTGIFNPFRRRSFEIKYNFYFDWKHLYYINLIGKTFGSLYNEPCTFDNNCPKIKNLKLDLSVIQKRFLYGSKNLGSKYLKLMKNDSFFFENKNN